MPVRFSELSGKEIISIDEGARLGIIDDSDLVIDTETGRIRSLLVRNRGSFFKRKTLVLSWDGIQKIGHDFVIVNLSDMEREAEALRRANIDF